MPIFKDLTKKSLIVGIIILLQIIPFNAAFAEEEIQETKTENPVTNTTQVMSEEEEKNELFMLQLRQQIQNSKNEYYQVKNNINEAKNRLIETTTAITSLKGQLANMNRLITNAQMKIRNVEKQVAQKEIQSGLLREEIRIKKIELENQKLLLKDYLKHIYIQENAFYSKRNHEISIPKLLLSQASIGETFQEIQYFIILEQTGQNIFFKIDDLKDQFEVQSNNLKTTQLKLTKLNEQLNEDKTYLKIQKNAKDKLLSRTQGEEDIYRELIAHSKQEQLALLGEINSLVEGLQFIEDKILEQGDDFNPDDYQDLIKPNIRAIYDFELNGEFIAGETLGWPVNPSRGISAYFRDPSYQAAFGIRHNAIDLPVPQGTPVKAPAGGVVYKVKDNGDNSYSYIILAHKGGIQTVFGHMYSIMVDERDIVFPGEIIGLSGGIPGTKGAGYLTTGAHLHFEVIKGGKHIDPLLLLPLDQLPEAYIPKLKEEEPEEETTE